MESVVWARLIDDERLNRVVRPIANDDEERCTQRWLIWLMKRRSMREAAFERP